MTDALSAPALSVLAKAAPEAPEHAGAAALPPWLQLINHPLVWFGIKFAGALLLLWLGVRIGRWTANLERRVLLRAHVDQILAEFLRNVTYAAILALIVLSALEFTGFPTTSLFAVLGAAGLAVGLALKDSLAHIAAGVLLIVLRPFRVGDTVNIAGQEGIIEGVFIFQTRLHTADNRDIVFMNGAVVAAPIVNYSQRDTRRADITLMLAHAADLHAAFAAAKAALGADERVLAQPAPVIALADITERGVALSVQAWTRSAQNGEVRSALLLRLHAELAQRHVGLAQRIQYAPARQA